MFVATPNVFAAAASVGPGSSSAPSGGSAGLPGSNSANVESTNVKGLQNTGATKIQKRQVRTGGGGIKWLVGHNKTEAMCVQAGGTVFYHNGPNQEGICKFVPVTGAPTEYYNPSKNYCNSAGGAFNISGWNNLKVGGVPYTQTSVRNVPTGLPASGAGCSAPSSVPSGSHSSLAATADAPATYTYYNSSSSASASSMSAGSAAARGGAPSGGL